MISADAAAQVRSLLDQLRMIVDAHEAAAVTTPGTAAAVTDTGGLATAAGARRTFPGDFFDDYGKFFDFLRSNKMLGPTLEDSEWKGCEAIIRAFVTNGSPISHCAYALATAYLETNSTMQPVRESYWLSTAAAERYATRMYDINGARPAKARELGNLTPGDGAKFMGRGYVQLTGRKNYERATKKLLALGFDVDLGAKPELAMRPDLAAVIMVFGMTEGWFTARKLSDDLPPEGPATFDQFERSRDIINGKDKQAEIARFAIDFQTGLLRAGYRV